jgi:purine-nucleoside phosphorylase
VRSVGGRAEQVATAAAAVASRLGGRRPEIAVVLGSGLGLVADRVREAVRISYADIPGFSVPTVEGHKGELVAGTLGGKDVLVQSGRFHMYEGHTPDEAALPVRVFASLGVRILIVTNAAGGIRATFAPGTLMLIRDHINLTGQSPLTGTVLPGEQRFPDMSVAYDHKLRRLAHDVAGRLGMPLEEGVYAALPGPSYETPAEIQYLDRIGADAVGMSTVMEVIAARSRRLKVMGLSTITNLAAGKLVGKLSHAEVMEVAAHVGDRVAGLIEGIVAGTE